jgi:hypothetical protein
MCALLAFLLVLAAVPREAFAQGCVAVRNAPATPIIPGDFTNMMASASRWVGSVSYRWLYSDRHFVGDHEAPERQELGTDVRNDVHSIDVSATYGINDRWSVTFTLPFTYADRSSIYEHAETFAQFNDTSRRNTMHAGGLGDVRLVTDYWLFDPHTHHNGNLSLGFGVEAPTGDDHASDLVHRSSGAVYRPVDPSIQPGDGGWGIILQMQGYQRIAKNLFGYIGGSYMITPEEQNNTELTIADLPILQGLITDEIRHDTIADQYSGRFGLSYFVWPERGISLSLGPRIDGVPAHDAIGGDMGFRRPGFSIAVEPGISWTHTRHNFSLTAPVAVYRNRERSAPEDKLGRPGGDSAFADFLIFASYSLRF